MLEKELIAKIQQVKNVEDARLLISFVYPLDASSTDDFYSSSSIQDLSWNSFYAIVDLEEQYELGHFSSAYVATSLVLPKISKMYVSISRNCSQDKGDFCSKVFMNICDNIIPKWDKNKNDNFFAFLQPNLRTSYNEMLEGEDGPSKYLQTTKGLSVTSIEGMNEHLESGFEAKDSSESVEDIVLLKIQREKRSLLPKIIGLDEEKGVTNANIWNSIVCQKLFHSDKIEFALVDDAAIASNLELYFDKLEKTKAKKMNAVVKQTSINPSIGIEGKENLESSEEELEALLA